MYNKPEQQIYWWRFMKWEKLSFEPQPAEENHGHNVIFQKASCIPYSIFVIISGMQLGATETKVALHLFQKFFLSSLTWVFLL